MSAPSFGGRPAAHADLAIFGSGFAAYELARTAVQDGRSVLIIERGAAVPEAADPRLSQVPFQREPITSGGFDFGAQVPAAFNGVPRYVGLGGTSELWSGKWRRLDHLDLTRSYGDRRWPFPPHELTPHYDAVAADYGWPAWPPALPGEDLAAIAARGLRLLETYEEQPPLRLRSRWAALEQTGRLRILCDSELLGTLTPERTGRLRGVRLRRDGDEMIATAGTFVVACGGIGSVSVSHRLRAGCAPSYPLPRHYGGFMDHPKAFIGQLTPQRHSPLLERLHATRAANQRLLAFSLVEQDLTPDAGNHTLFIWPAASRGEPCRLVINLEQFPEEHNAVSAATGAVTWRLSRRLWIDFETFAGRIAPRLGALLNGTVRLDPRPLLRGASHHAGALPMGDGPQAQADRNGRFHGTENVYGASSALFPLAGSANPTMTVVALARRLAQHLRTGTA